MHISNVMVTSHTVPPTGTGFRVRGPHKHIILIRARHAEHHHPTNIKEHDPPKSPEDGLRHFLFDIRRLAERRANNLRPNIRKRSLDDGRPEPQETTEVALLEILPKGARVSPVVETDDSAPFDGLERGNEARDDEHCHDCQLEDAGDILRLAKYADVEEVDQNDRQGERRDEDARVQVWAPVLDDEAGRS